MTGGARPRLLRDADPVVRVLYGVLAGPLTAGDVAALAPRDWDRLVLAAEREKATIVLARALAPHVAAAGATVPVGATTLARLALVTEFRMLQLEARLEQSVAALRAAGIPCLLLKGAALAATYYGSCTARPMLDIDLVVPRDAVGRAYRTLVADAGWRETRSAAVDDPGALALHHCPPLRDASGVEVNCEVHAELLAPGQSFTLDAAAVWAEARPLDGRLAGAWVPSATHLVLHACIHFAWQHMMRSASWRTFRDIATVTQARFDWDAFVVEARDAKAATACWWTLRLGEGLAGLAVPRDVMRALAPSHPPVLRALLERHAVAVLLPGDGDCPSARVRRALWAWTLEPERSGHGDARPWQGRGGPGADIEVVPTLLTVVQSSRDPRAWMRYARRLVRHGGPGVARTHSTL